MSLLQVIPILILCASALASDDAAELESSTLQRAETGVNTSTRSESDSEERKTLSQQVADGKYGLIQRELFHEGRNHPLGVISYRTNSEVPHDNGDNLGGLTKEEIWLAEDHLLVIKGGQFDPEEGSLTLSAAVPPIDDYRAPNRQVKIPSKPKIPPPFPIRLQDGGPLQILAPAHTDIHDHEETDNAAGPYSPDIPSRGIKKYNVKSPRPSSGNFGSGARKNNQTKILDPATFDPDDHSIYYPPPYSFYYPKDNTSLVPPGPLVPGIVLPPPPDFFGPLHPPSTTIQPPNSQKTKPTPSENDISDQNTIKTTPNYDEEDVFVKITPPTSTKRPYFSSTTPKSHILRDPKPKGRFPHRQNKYSTPKSTTKHTPVRFPQVPQHSGRVPQPQNVYTTHKTPIYNSPEQFEQVPQNPERLPQQKHEFTTQKTPNYDSQEQFLQVGRIPQHQNEFTSQKTPIYDDSEQYEQVPENPGRHPQQQNVYTTHKTPIYDSQEQYPQVPEHTGRVPQPQNVYTTHKTPIYDSQEQFQQVPQHEGRVPQQQHEFTTHKTPNYDSSEEYPQHPGRIPQQNVFTTQKPPIYDVPEHQQRVPQQQNVFTTPNYEVPEHYTQDPEQPVRFPQRQNIYSTSKPQIQENPQVSGRFPGVLHQIVYPQTVEEQIPQVPDHSGRFPQENPQFYTTSKPQLPERAPNYGTQVETTPNIFRPKFVTRLQPTTPGIIQQTNPYYNRNKSQKPKFVSSTTPKPYLPPQTTPIPKNQAPKPVYFEYFETNKPNLVQNRPEYNYQQANVYQKEPIRPYISSTQVPLRAYYKNQQRPTQIYFYEEDPRENEIKTQKGVLITSLGQQNTFDRHIEQLRNQIRFQQNRQQRLQQQKRFRTPRPVYQYSFGYPEAPKFVPNDFRNQQTFQNFRPSPEFNRNPIGTYNRPFFQEVTTRPPNLISDVDVNYRRPLPQKNPQAEYFSGTSEEGGPGTFISYKLPGDGAHFYFLTPQLAQNRNDRDGYFYPNPRGS